MKAILNAKLILVLLLISVCGLVTKAQHTNFIYIQAEHNQPFYVSTDNKTYNSSEVGYLIIPKLGQGKHELTIGFPNNTFPPQLFSISIDKKDLGFHLKNLKEKGWALADVHTKEPIYGTASLGQIPELTGNSSTSSDKKETVSVNAFGAMLSDVVNDPTLTQASVFPAHTNNPFLQKEDKNAITSENRPMDASEIGQKETSQPVADDNSGSDNHVSGEPVETVTKGIIKASEKTNEEGTDLVFIDFKNYINDTIHVFIPSENAKTVTTENPEEVSKPEEKLQHAASDANKKSGETPGFINMEEKDKKDNAVKKVENPFFAKEEKEKTIASEASKPVLSQPDVKIPATKSSGCNKMVSENDLDKIKKRMVSQSGNDQMIQTVKKAVKGKCITTAQVKDLSGLFLSDEGRYNFYDAIFSFVYDSGNIKQLEDQLLDIYYKNRFKALIGY